MNDQIRPHHCRRFIAAIYQTDSAVLGAAAFALVLLAPRRSLSHLAEPPLRRPPSFFGSPSADDNMRLAADALVPLRAGAGFAATGTERAASEASS